MSKTEFVDDTPPHLTIRHTAVPNTQLRTVDLGQREYWCRECHARVTRTRDGSAEYGHDPACEHSIRKRDDHALGWRGPMDEENETCK